MDAFGKPILHRKPAFLGLQKSLSPSCHMTGIVLVEVHCHCTSKIFGMICGNMFPKDTWHALAAPPRFPAAALRQLQLSPERED